MPRLWFRMIVASTLTVFLILLAASHNSSPGLQTWYQRALDEASSALYSAQLGGQSATTNLVDILNRTLGVRYLILIKFLVLTIASSKKYR